MMMGLLMTISCSLFALCNTLTTDDECAHHATLAASMLSVGAISLLAQTGVETSPLPFYVFHFWFHRQFSVRRRVCWSESPDHCQLANQGVQLRSWNPTALMEKKTWLKFQVLAHSISGKYRSYKVSTASERLVYIKPVNCVLWLKITVSSEFNSLLWLCPRGVLLIYCARREPIFIVYPQGGECVRAHSLTYTITTYQHSRSL